MTNPTPPLDNAALDYWRDWITSDNCRLHGGALGCAIKELLATISARDATIAHLRQPVGDLEIEYIAARHQIDEDSITARRRRERFSGGRYAIAHNDRATLLQALQSRPAPVVTPWEPIATIPDCDDLLWFCRGDTYEGPRGQIVDDADYWDWWCYAKPPALPK